VAYRIGENGSICILYEDEVPKTPPPKKQPVTPPKSQPSPPPQQAPSPPPALPHHHHQHQQHLQELQQTHQSQQVHHHFSPSKSVVMSNGLHQSPPLSPITTHHQQQQQAAAAALSMFFMSGKDNGLQIKCKESLRGGLDARRLQLVDPLFVSS